MKTKSKATFSRYNRGAHEIDNKFISESYQASIAESLNLFNKMLATLAEAGIKTGTKLIITIETIK